MLNWQIPGALIPAKSTFAEEPPTVMVIVSTTGAAPERSDRKARGGVVDRSQCRRDHGIPRFCRFGWRTWSQ